MADPVLNIEHREELRDVPPEEEELFKEFQSYVRTIYMAATDGAVQSLQQATKGLRGEVAELQLVVRESRQDFITLFDPAVRNFDSAAGRVLKEMAQRQEVISEQQEERFEQAIRKISDEHKVLAKAQSDSFGSLVETRSKQFLWSLVSAMSLLITSLALLVVLLRR